MTTFYYHVIVVIKSSLASVQANFIHSLVR